MPTAGVRALLRRMLDAVRSRGTGPTFDPRSPGDLAGLLARFGLRNGGGGALGGLRRPTGSARCTSSGPTCGRCSRSA
jgi:hypothetical protein